MKIDEIKILLHDPRYRDRLESYVRELSPLHPSLFSFHSSQPWKLSRIRWLRIRRRLRVGENGDEAGEQRVTSRPLSTYNVRIHTHNQIHGEHAPWNGVGRGGGRGVCYRYRATWPRGDRDNASPSLLSARRFACFDPVPTYLPTYVTYVRIRRHRHHRRRVRSFRHAPLRPTGSYFCGASRHAAFAKPRKPNAEGDNGA